jgi:DNA replication licensing factor MCM6
LNARTSILAAANPIFGRYDKSKNLQKNINISPPIMSRFDLFFVICDESSQSHDSNLCEFMIRMHREKDNALSKRYDTKTIRFYMSVAKKIKPRLTREAAEKLRGCYLKLRENSKVVSGMSYIATVRQLESMIRLSEAIARLHLDIDITAGYVDEAYKLISSSITKLEKADVVIDDEDEIRERENQKVQNLILEEEIKKKKQEKKEKTITLSPEVY